MYDLASDRQRKTRAHNESTVGPLLGENEATIFCECGHTSCSETLTLETGMYRKIRHHGAWFLLAADHELANEQHVVLRQPSFVVVEGV